MCVTLCVPETDGGCLDFSNIWGIIVNIGHDVYQIGTKGGYLRLVNRAFNFSLQLQLRLREAGSQQYMREIKI